MSVSPALTSYANCIMCLAKLSDPKNTILLGQTVGSCWETTRQSRIGFNVAPDINNIVVDFYFFVRLLSRLLCCVVSGSIVALFLETTHWIVDWGCTKAGLDTVQQRNISYLCRESILSSSGHSACSLVCIHSFSGLSYDRPKASSKASSPRSAI